MKKIIKIVLIVLLCVLLISFVGISYFIGTQVFASSTQLVTNETTTGISDGFVKQYNFDFAQFSKDYHIQNIEVASTLDKHTIPADYIYAKGFENNMDNKTVVLVHGLGANRYSNYPIAEMFLNEGYNVITYDQRSTNENKAQYTTFGYLEKYDLIDLINYADSNTKAKTIGVWGTSFGGATAGLALGNKEVEEKVDFLILDCPVSSMKWMVEEEIKHIDVGLPIPYITLCGNIINKIKLGFTYEDADVSKAVKNLKIPVLIINSKADTTTPFFMGQDIYDSIQGDNKTIWTVEDSEHTDMWLEHNAEYREYVLKLIEKFK